MIHVITSISQTECDTKAVKLIISVYNNYQLFDIFPFYFRCTNNNCVPKGKVCDYIDDCGDSSDEDLSLCSNYMGCAFDNDPRFCNLKQEKISDDFDWTIHRGQTDSVNTGPTHDHTFKTFKGKSSRAIIFLGF